MFQRLEDEGIHVVDDLRYYPYRATFDFECFFDGKNLPNATDHVEWVARHVPLSVSVASNVPGYEAPCCFVSDGDSNKLVAQMMTHLHSISDTAFESLKPSYESVLDNLKMLKEEWDSAEKECGLEGGETEDEVVGKNRTNPFKKLSDQLFGWLQQLPVIGFNSGKYDLNMIKTILHTFNADTLRGPRRIMFCNQTREYVHVFLDEQSPFPRCNKFSSSGRELRKVSESLRM